VFLALSQPEEVRAGRWFKIAISVPLVWAMSLILQGGLSLGMIAFLFMLLTLGIVWCGNISHFLSVRIVHFLFDTNNPSMGFRPSFDYARTAIRDGELEEAVKLIKVELAKDPKNYEGRMLMTRVLDAMQVPAEAMAHLAVILENPEATDSQKQCALAEKERLEMLLALRSGKPWPNPIPSTTACPEANQTAATAEVETPAAAAAEDPPPPETSSPSSSSAPSEPRTPRKTDRAEPIGK
jgi:hypothetical protein